jgi:hypothetical protein
MTPTTYTRPIERFVGWEDYYDLPLVGPGAVINAPALTPSPLSLLTSCPVLDAGSYPDDLPPESKGKPSTSVFGEPVGERWENGFDFLPEIIGPADGYPTCGEGFTDALRLCPEHGIRAAFLVVMDDTRSTLGYKASDAQQRVQRGLLAHECWRVENQWWTGSIDPTQPHLAAVDPYYPVGPAAVGVRESLAALEGAIGEKDAGQGIICCTPFLMNYWASRGGVPFRYDGSPSTPGGARRIWTPNGNLIVPGYGFDGSAPTDQPTIASPRYAHQQWAFATDMVTLLRGPITVLPDSYEEMSPAIVQTNVITWRARRPWGIFSNGALRAAVLVDTTVD